MAKDGAEQRVVMMTMAPAPAAAAASAATNQREVA
jgi:hypothetical protein